MKFLFQRSLVIAVVFMLMALWTACAGVSSTTTGGPVMLTGTIQSVNTTTDSVTMTTQGQTVTINGLTSTQAAALQNQVGKTYTFTVTQNSDGSYTISSRTNPVSVSGTPASNVTPNANATGTPAATQQTGINAPGSISFIGRVQSVSNNSIIVSMPNGAALSMAITALTNRSDFNGGLPATGQTIKVDASTNPDGSFTATKLGATDLGDLSDPNKLNTVQFQGVTTSSVGSDRVLHFNVGNKSYSFLISPTADMKDFNNNLQAIPANQAVKVTVLFNGATGTVLKIGNPNT